MRRLDLPSHIVAYKAKSGNTTILLHDSTKGALCILSHTISLIQNDDLIWRTWKVAVEVSHEKLIISTFPSLP
jgi:hypothetical protein